MSNGDSTTVERVERVDEREQLVNQGKTGPITEVALSEERITQLRGILFDLDPKLYAAGGLPTHVPADPHEFWTEVASHWLSRDPVLAKAEVRMSGTGLHVLLWLQEPVQLLTDGERDRWAGIVRVVQAALPTDPGQPGITAVTRPIGSTNGKCGRQVEVIHQGSPVTAEEVLALFDRLSRRPFHTVFQILTGEERLSPCPICRGEDSSLGAGSEVGHCYGSCGKVTLEQLYDLVFAPINGKEADHVQTN